MSNQLNDILPFTKVDVAKNYIGIQLDQMDVLQDGDQIRINLTPAMPDLATTGEHDENGFKLSWSATDTGAEGTCTFSNPF